MNDVIIMEGYGLLGKVFVKPRIFADKPIR